MFTDPFHLINSLEHDYREEKCRKINAYDCRRCALTFEKFKAKNGEAWEKECRKVLEMENAGSKPKK
jgi:hypothetical protein